MVVVVCLRFRVLCVGFRVQGLGFRATVGCVGLEGISFSVWRHLLLNLADVGCFFWGWRSLSPKALVP